MNLLKISIVILISILFLSINSLNAQHRTNATQMRTTQQKDKTVVIKARGVNYHFNAIALKEGKSRKKLSGSTLVEFVKKRGKVVSVKIQGKSGVWTSNILAANTGKQEFNCTDNTCICVGDDDCNLMITSNVCKMDGPIVDGVCTDTYPPVCECNQNNN